MSKISNVLSMIEILSTGKKYSILELSSLLEVSPRMIRVYKDEIEKSGIYIDTIKGPYGGYVLNQKISLPKRNNTKGIINIENKENYNLINKAIKEERKCLIEYYSKDKTNTTKRIIHPLDIYCYDDEFYTTAFCELRKDMRNFNINRIKNIKILEKF